MRSMSRMARNCHSGRQIRSSLTAIVVAEDVRFPVPNPDKSR
jgi:hypothetical protein